MPFVAPLLSSSQSQSAVHDTWHYAAKFDVGGNQFLYQDATQQLIDSFTVADVEYRLRGAVRAHFHPPHHRGMGKFVVTGLSPQYVGEGFTLDKAKRDWELKIDHAIQTLLATQDFERTKEQLSEWELLSEYFDLPSIRYARPFRVRMLGKVRAAFPQWKIQWIDGTRNVLTREQIPSEMVRFKPGQPFEAVVERDSRTGLLTRVMFASPVSDIPRLSERESLELLSGLPKSSELPLVDWD